MGDENDAPTRKECCFALLQDYWAASLSMAAFLLTLLIFVAALLYSTVGHGGASGYLAAMALFNTPPDVMKPTALVLNLFVAGVGTIRYARAGWVSWNTVWPFALLSAPLAY